MYIQEVAAWEIVTWEVSLGKMPSGKYFTPHKRILLWVNLQKEQLCENDLETKSPENKSSKTNSSVDKFA